MKNSDSTVAFLGIGAHKSATTWLAHVMRAHEQLWIPLAKEIHYFDRATHYDSPNTLNSSRFLERIGSKKPENRQWRKSACRDFLSSIARMDFQRFKWNFNYYTGTINDDWYLRLFPGNSSRLCGEITPAYSMLNVEDIRRINALLPNVKVIYLLRDPIDRAWSHLRYDQGSGEKLNLDKFSELKKYIDSPTLTRRGDYVSTLRDWTSVISSDRIFVGFYDDIKSRPNYFLERLSSFLNIDHNLFPQQEVKTNILVSQKRKIPEEVELYLAKKYLNDLEYLADTLGEHTVKWHQRAATILSRSNQ